MLVTFQGSAAIGGFSPSIIVSRGILLPPVLAAIPKDSEFTCQAQPYRMLLRNCKLTGFLPSVTGRRALPGSFGRLACKRALEFKELENGTVREAAGIRGFRPPDIFCVFLPCAGVSLPLRCYYGRGALAKAGHFLVGMDKIHILSLGALHNPEKTT